MFPSRLAGWLVLVGWALGMSHSHSLLRYVESSR